MKLFQALRRGGQKIGGLPARVAEARRKRAEEAAAERVRKIAQYEGYLRTLKSLTEAPEIIFSHAEALAKLKGKGALGKFREFRKSPGSRSLSTAMEWMEKNLISQEK